MKKPDHDQKNARNPNCRNQYRNQNADKRAAIQGEIKLQLAVAPDDQFPNANDQEKLKNK
jgi:hypothetical protein